MTIINTISTQLAANDAHHDLKRFMDLEKPGADSIVLAVETVTSSARTYVHVTGSEETDQYEEITNFFDSYYHPMGRAAAYPFTYALHEVVREGINRRVMFDVDYKKGVPLATLLSQVALLKAACAAAYESYGNPWETDITTDAFRLTVSDAKAPFKGFHLLLTSVAMPAASIARLYCAVREILASGTVGSLEDGKLLSDAIDDKPTDETFNMRLYGSPKINRPGTGRGTATRQKRLLIDDKRVEYDSTVDMREYLIQPGPARSANDQLVHQRTLHPDDEGKTRSRVTCVESSSDGLSERLAGCELLNGWVVRGEVKTGEYSAGTSSPTPWWRQDLTFTSGERHECIACKCVHRTRTDYLWLTGEGLVDESKPIYVRCRSRVQTAEEKTAGLHRYNVVATIPGLRVTVESRVVPLAASLKYPFSFEGYTGKALKTPLTTFLAVQKLAHVAAIDALDRSAETKRAEKAQLNADIAAAVAHQITVMEKSSDESNPLYDALNELKVKGADYSIYGQRDFDDLDTRVYKTEYEMLCAIHCNAWTHDQEGAAIWDEGRWEPKNWDDQRVKAKREQMHFRIASGAQYSGKDFWKTITRAYARNSQTSFTPHPLGRSAIGLPSPSVWRMGRGINNYNGLRAVKEVIAAPKHALVEHVATFEHFLRSQIAGEGDEYYRYLMGWLASAMQRPHQKIGVALLIRGPMGCGKSLFVSLLKRIVPHASVVTNKGLSTLTDKFNTDSDNRTLYMFGEVGEARHISADQIAALKTLITDDEQHVEYKNKTIVQKKQYLNLIVCSNMLNCIETSEGDRRWCVLDNPFPVHDKDDRDYWERIWPLFTEDVSFAASIQQLLLDYDLGAPGSYTAWSAKEYPKSDALQVTRNELPIVNYALKYPQLRERVTTYLEGCGGYEIDRPATLRDIVLCHRMDEGDSSRGDSAEKQEKDLYYALCNIPQIAQRFSFHPDNDGGRLARTDTNGHREVLKHAIVWGVDAEESHGGSGAPLTCSAAVRDRDTAMVKMVAMMRAAGLNVSEFTDQFPALGDGPERYDSMGQSALRAVLKERGIAYSGRDSVAVLRAKLRAPL